ncbi:MAG: chemotaxis protein CheA [Bacteroidales bacterium]|nr:chemotaxis protein CheA [Bacteroidales bacterium]
MLEQFKQKYLEEVNDLLNELESTLLELEQKPSDEEDINKVFRVMHTIKGTSGMYDFKIVEKLTHDIESIYGKIRDNHESVNKDIITITLEGVDLIRRLLNQPSNNDQNDVDIFTTHLATICDEPLTLSENSNNNNIFENNNIATYYIQFIPEADITNRGINIKNILDDIDKLGNGIIIPRSWPEDEQYANKFYMYWEAIYSTEKTYNELQEIFIFVPDEVKITKIADADLIANEQFVEEIQKSQANETPIKIEDLANLANKITGGCCKILSNNNKNQEINSNKNQENQNNEEKSFVKNLDALDNKANSIKVDSDKLDELMNLVSELVTTKAEMLLLADKYNIPELSTICEKIDKLSNKFKDNALSIRLVPIESMMLRFERLVRDLSKELNKQIDFITEGTDTELDKTIIDNLAVPLMHIIRNSIDHGIEPVERRRELKKTDHGIIKFTAFYSGANVFIQVQDDGAGMNPEYLRKKAIEKGFIKPDQVVTDRQLYDLVFLPGFSTAQKITGISGRGVGMDVVKQNIVKLRGEIEMDSEINLGTITTIKLPLTLSIVDALLVSIEETFLLIPLYVIDSCIQVKTTELFSENGHFIFENEPLPIINLRQLLEIEGNNPEETNVILVKYKDGRIGLTVDKVIGEHQAVLKSLGKYFADQEYISGGSILGDGGIALVLDTNKLIKLIEKK